MSTAKIKKSKEATQTELRSFAKQFQEAKRKEIDSWIENDVYDLVDIWKLCKEGTNNPIIAPEDKQFIEVAITLIGEYPRDNDSWKTLTDKLNDLTGRSGKNLFMPLRNFLTGRSDGPDMKKLFPLMQKIQKCGLS